MAQKSITAMEAHADVLLSRSDRWATGTLNETGLTFYLFTSSRLGPDGQPILYHTIRDGSFCDCPSYKYRSACCHSLAVKRAAEAAREAVGPKRATYATLYPACQASGCDAEPEAHEIFCGRHAVVSAF